MTVETTTKKQVNISQLGYEMGCASLRSVGPDPDEVTVIRAVEDGTTVSQTDLDAAVAAHVADPNWEDPNPAPPTQEQVDATRLAELQTKAAAGTITEKEMKEATRLLLVVGAPG